MTRQPTADPHRGDHFSSAELGPLADLGRYTFEVPALGLAVPGKAFLNQAIGLTSAEISVNRMPPGGSVPFLHAHRENEEVYLFLAGRGRFQVDGTEFPVREGSVVRVAPAGERCWRNDGDADLVYVVIQAKAGSFPAGPGGIGDGVAVNKPVRWGG
jgi:quercetin dioxygenase-like cupin family protein